LPVVRLGGEHVGFLDHVEVSGRVVGLDAGQDVGESDHGQDATPMCNERREAQMITRRDGCRQTPGTSVGR
jgi:hypothetical protein